MREFVIVFNWSILGYFLTLNTILLIALLAGGRQVLQLHNRQDRHSNDDLFDNPITPGVSILVPAYNEEDVILDSVHSLLSTRYPRLEVIVTDDGSTDATFEIMREAYDLVEVGHVSTAEVATVGRITSTWRSNRDRRLRVIRKENASRRGDALNAALSVATMPLVAMVDADSVIAEDALLRIVRPFVNDPDRVVACGGVIQAVNGAAVSAGHVRTPAFPRRTVERLQAIEYLRAFVLARTGWSRFRGLLLISGAFGLFRRDILVKVGGFDSTSLAEDLELVIRIHQLLRDDDVDYEVAFSPEPVCWTEVPDSMEILARQRIRWSQGLAETLWKHRRLLFRPRYGRIGLVALPYYLAFEMMSPVVEVLGLVALAIGLWLGMVNVAFAILLFIASIGLSVMLSMLAVAIDRRVMRSYGGRHATPALTAAMVESLLYRWVHAGWRLKGLAMAVARREEGWGEMPRTGFLPLQTD